MCSSEKKAGPPGERNISTNRMGFLKKNGTLFHELKKESQIIKRLLLQKEQLFEEIVSVAPSESVILMFSSKYFEYVFFIYFTAS